MRFRLHLRTILLLIASVGIMLRIADSITSRFAAGIV